MGMARACKYNFMRKPRTDRSLKDVTQGESRNTVIVEMLFACVKGTEFSELFSVIVIDVNLSQITSRSILSFLVTNIRN
jgi:hypothetical protein